MQAKPNSAKIMHIFAGFGFFYIQGGQRLKVLRTINNNVVSCLDDSGRELVVMGRGLGFRAKPGDSLDPAAAEKVFRMDSPEEVSRLKNLFAQLPTELLELCNRIIDHATEALGHRLNESIYLTLTDHIQFAIDRIRKNMAFPNPLMTEVRVFYPIEFSVGKYALEVIEKQLKLRLPEDEAANIALHFVNAEFGGSMNSTIRSVQALQPSVQILHSWPGLKLNENHLFYDELIVHLKFMAMQSFSNAELEWVGPKLAQTVQDHFSQEYACAGAIAACLSEKSGVRVPAAEQAYLAICIHRACI